MQRFICLLVFLPVFLICNVNNVRKKYNISICAVFQNEQKYLKEWIEYHRLIGVDHFYLYNLTNYKYETILKEYIKKDVIILIDWPNFGKNQNDDILVFSTQIPAYENAIKIRAAQETKWLIFVDVEEFLLPIAGNNLNEIVQKYAEFPGIILPLVYFDASNTQNLSGKKLVIEATKRTTFRKPIRFEKILFKPDLCTCFAWPPYHFVFKEGLRPIQINEWEIRINHYLNRGKFSQYDKKVILRLDHQMPEKEITDLLEAGYLIEEHSMDRFLLPVKMLMEVL